MPPALPLLIAKGRWRRSSFSVSPVTATEAVLSTKWKERSSFLSILHFLPRSADGFICTSLQHVIHSIARCFYCFAAIGGYDNDPSLEPLALQGWLRLLDHLQDEQLFPIAELTDQGLLQKALHWALDTAQTILVNAIGFFQQPSVFLPVLADPDKGISTEVVATSLGPRLLFLRRHFDSFHISTLRSAAIPDLSPFFVLSPAVSSGPVQGDTTRRPNADPPRLSSPRISPSPFIQFIGERDQKHSCLKAIIQLLRERRLSTGLCVAYARQNSQGCSRSRCKLRHVDKFRNLERPVQDILREVADSPEHRQHIRLLL